MADGEQDVAETGSSRLPKYMILKLREPDDGEQDDGTQLWEPMRTEEAARREQAIEQAVLALGGDAPAEGTFKAVAMSSWAGGVVKENKVETTSTSRPFVGDGEGVSA